MGHDEADMDVYDTTIEKRKLNNKTSDEVRAVERGSEKIAREGDLDARLRAPIVPYIRQHVAPVKVGDGTGLTT